jgi:6-phosphogluconolactonase
MQQIVQICEDADSLARHACRWFVECIGKHCSQSQRKFTLALSGGSTPKRLYQLLGKLPEGEIDWDRVVLLWGDERNVAADDRDSNLRMVRESLLDHIRIPAENVLAVPGPERDAKQVAAEYQALLEQQLPLADDGWPPIDCILLGLGDDVHTASLFPYSDALQESQRWVTENWVEKLGCWRITLTAAFINRSREVVFLISGATKQAAVAHLWHGPADPVQFPAQLIRPEDGRLWYLLDRPALGNNSVPASAEREIISP